MATVTVIREKVKPVVPPIKEVVLTMSELQARMLLSVCRRIGGTGPKRRATDEISVALCDAGFKDVDDDEGQHHLGTLLVQGD